jgi:hypothetical protein
MTYEEMREREEMEFNIYNSIIEYELKYKTKFEREDIEKTIKYSNIEGIAEFGGPC